MLTNPDLFSVDYLTPCPPETKDVLISGLVCSPLGGIEGG